MPVSYHSSLLLILDDSLLRAGWEVQRCLFECVQRDGPGNVRNVESSESAIRGAVGEDGIVFMGCGGGVVEELDPEGVGLLVVSYVHGGYLLVLDQGI